MGFKIGDSVRLVKGGPRMHVQWITNWQPLGPELGAYCIWRQGNVRCAGVFELEDLVMLNDALAGAPAEEAFRSNPSNPGSSVPLASLDSANSGSEWMEPSPSELEALCHY